MNKVICFGEVLWDIFPDVSLPGGAPFNVCAHLMNFKIPAVLISKVGNDSLGKDIVEFASTKGIDTEFIQVSNSLDTGTVYIQKTAEGDSKYEITENVAWDDIEFVQDIESLTRESDYVVFGSLALRKENNKEVLRSIFESDLIRVFDINLRNPLPEKSTIKEFLGQSDIVKMNDEELKLVGNWFGIEEVEIEKVMQDLCEQFQLKELYVTRGANGAIAFNGNEFTEHPGFPVRVIDTTGSGDSFLAAIISGKINKKPLAELLSFACATGSTVAKLKGGIPDLSINQIEETLNENH